MSYGENPFQNQFDALPVETRLNLLKSGVQGFKMNPPRPGENSGQVTVETTPRTATIKQRYGDPMTWMQQFMPPMKNQLVALRHPTYSDEFWKGQVAERKANIAKYGSPIAPGQHEMDEAWRKANGR